MTEAGTAWSNIWRSTSASKEQAADGMIWEE
jgi:hypothetical protein